MLLRPSKYQTERLREWREKNRQVTDRFERYLLALADFKDDPDFKVTSGGLGDVVQAVIKPTAEELAAYDEHYRMVDLFNAPCRFRIGKIPDYDLSFMAQDS